MHEEQNKRSPQTPVTLSLLIPGLLAFRDTFTRLTSSEKDSIKHFSFPVIEKWLSRGRASTVNQQESHLLSFIENLAAHSQNIPYAALSLLAEDDDELSREEVEAYRWLRADPVYIQPDRDTVRLLAYEEINLQVDEASRIAREINHHFKDEPWQLISVQPGNWYLRLEKDYQFKTHPHLHIKGMNIDEYAPSGEDADYWLQILNEIQMLLHGMHVNFERESRGELTVNSLWLWGYGSLNDLPHPGDIGTLFSNNDQLQGLARLLEVNHYEAEEILEKNCPVSSGLIVVDELMPFVTCHDVYGFLETLERLDKTLFTELDKMLCPKQVKSINLCADQDTAFQLTSNQLKRWWKRVRPLVS